MRAKPIANYTDNLAVIGHINGNIHLLRRSAARGKRLADDHNISRDLERDEIRLVLDCAGFWIAIVVVNIDIDESKRLIGKSATTSWHEIVRSLGEDGEDVRSPVGLARQHRDSFCRWLRFRGSGHAPLTLGSA